MNNKSEQPTGQDMPSVEDVLTKNLNSSYDAHDFFMGSKKAMQEYANLQNAAKDTRIEQLQRENQSLREQLNQIGGKP